MASSTAGATLPDHDTESTENLTGADLDRFVLSYIIKAGEKGVTRKVYANNTLVAAQVGSLSSLSGTRITDTQYA